jgi:hypothetical protein
LCWCVWQESGFSRREDIFAFNLLYKKCINVVRFQVLTAASMKIPVFWDVALCNLVEVY